MNGLIRANIRHHGRRYAATILAVAIATAFGVLSLALGNGMGMAMKNAFISSYLGADVVVEESEAGSGEYPFEDVDGLIEKIKQVPGVENVAPITAVTVDVESNGVRTFGQAAVAHEGFFDPEYSEGAKPVGRQVAVDRTVADALEVGVGDTVNLSAAGGGETSALEISGLYGNSGVASVSLDEILVTQEGLEALVEDPWVSRIQIAGSNLDEAGRESLAGKVRAVLPSADLSIRTQDQVLEEQLSQINTSIAAMNAVVGIFPLIAGVVALIVVTTTFQVIFQQRLRELALLRCLGATQRQVRRMLLGESLVVGAVASLIGVAVGTLLGAGLVSGLGLLATFGEALVGTSLWSVGGVFLFGTIITVLAGLRPATKVGRVAPIEALGVSAAPVAKRTKGWWVRLLLGTALFVAGTVLMFTAGSRQDTTGFVLAVLGGLMALFGAILALSAALPWFVSALGMVFRGVIGQMARGNAMRNPGRTAATGVSVVIGVALIVMMMVGSASLRTTMDQTLDAQIPTDIVLTKTGSDGMLTSLSEDDLRKVEEVGGIETAALQRGVYWDGADEPPATLNGEPISVADVQAIADVARSEVPVPETGQIFVNIDSGFTEGESLTFCLAGSCDEYLAVPQTFIDYGLVSVPGAVLDQAGDAVETIAIVAQLKNVSDQAKVGAELQRLDSSYAVGGAAAMRVQFEQALGAMLAVVVGLLAVSVLVALVGVSNTLSLSVAERTRENGLLRALGMTKRQLSGLLTLEAVLIALAGAVLGTGLGILFGFGGMLALPLQLNHLAVVVPWWQLAAVVGVTIVAAVLAAWIPSRRAKRVSPVEALATN